jgi:hypothetical protein
MPKLQSKTNVPREFQKSSDLLRENPSRSDDPNERRCLSIYMERFNLLSK